MSVQQQHPIADDLAFSWPYWDWENGDDQDQSRPIKPKIDEKRQQFLTEHRGITPDIKKGIYPFKDIELTRADIEWLLLTHENERGPVDWGDGKQRGRKGLDLRGANLRKADLSYLPLACMCGGLTPDESLGATPEQRDIAAVHLEGANLMKAHLEGARLRRAHLEDANLFKAHLEESELRAAHLEGADLAGAHLAGANARRVFFNAANSLHDIILNDDVHGSVSLLDVRWGGANLGVVNWATVNSLGDEQEARQRTWHDGKLKDKATRLVEYEMAVRAYRQLAVELRTQGLNEHADRFAYQAQKLQRVVLRWKKKFGQYLFSLFLDVLAGYGYRPGRSVLWYLFIVVIFALTYSAFGHLSLWPPDALIYSLTSFHGRGFFPGLEGKHSLHDPLIMLAALEAVVGLFIEISFIATFTQRFFGR